MAVSIRRFGYDPAGRGEFWIPSRAIVATIERAKPRLAKGFNLLRLISTCRERSHTGYSERHFIACDLLPARMHYRSRRSLPAAAAIISLLLIAAFDSAIGQSTVYVSRFWHNHQPIYRPERNSNGSQTNRVQYAWDSIALKNGQTSNGLCLTGSRWFALTARYC